MCGTTQASRDDIDIMSIWGSLRRSRKSMLLASLATIGAHTRRHLGLTILDTEIACDEMAGLSGASSKSWAAPAVISAIPAVALPAPASANSKWPARWACAPRSRPARARSMRLTPTARPNCRFFLKGDYQDPRHVKVMFSGMPFRLWNALGRATDESESI